MNSLASPPLRTYLIPTFAALFQDGKIKNGDDGVKFVCHHPKFFRLPYDCTFRLLKQKVFTTYDRPTNIAINKLSFRRSIINSDQTITIEVVQI
ncbi:hypothetical protein VIGAN_01189200 [Vigna angularis var. angularis]|uniref:Uncharacterized protein n=1 Tax=Vigna angularis var. angularis TaxID=157739 RepID=A0A0S3R151_PHAAN|nr:hypothetical protein VIGAN_01189200 [Vigna angularis var. angularis]